MAEKRDWFEGVEPPVGDEAVKRVEAVIGSVLPEDFKHFAMTFGGGYFGGTNISTLDETSNWYILSRPSLNIDGNRFIVVSDDEAGGYYGFLSNNGSISNSVFYFHPDDGAISQRESASFFDFVEKHALDL
jgi:hypothetical protein